MAAARSYRDDLQRLHFVSNRIPKDGHSRGKQTAALDAAAGILRGWLCFGLARPQSHSCRYRNRLYAYGFRILSYRVVERPTGCFARLCAKFIHCAK